jgi:hypothetical protein
MLEPVDSALPAAVYLFLFENKHPLKEFTGLLDWKLMGNISRLMINGFITGQLNEAVFLAPGKKLPFSHLILHGLGKKEDFDEFAFQTALLKMQQSQNNLKDTEPLIALPGRPENISTPQWAIEQFLGFLEKDSKTEKYKVIDSPEAQKIMIPIAERWRLKHSIEQTHAFSI